jgi:hypothetical protein
VNSQTPVPLTKVNKARWKALLWKKKQKDNEMFRNFETNYYLCTDEIKTKWQDTLVIATHGIIKKTQKTPKKEIAKAERIRQEYFNAKK